MEADAWMPAGLEELTRHAVPRDMHATHTYLLHLYLYPALSSASYFWQFVTQLVLSVLLSTHLCMCHLCMCLSIHIPVSGGHVFSFSLSLSPSLSLSLFLSPSLSLPLSLSPSLIKI